MAKLDKNLQDWVALGFITDDQASKIRTHEEIKPENSWVMRSLLGLGVFIISMGIVSLIAANWYQIGDNLKLAGNFALLGLTAFAIWTYRAHDKILYLEALLLFFMLLCLASIGLHSQIFHLEGKFYQAILLWCLITFPLNFLSRQLAVPFAWAGGFLFALVFMVFDSSLLEGFFKNNSYYIAMAIPLLYTLFTVVTKTFLGEQGLTRAFRYWSVSAGIGAIVIAEMPKHFTQVTNLTLTPFIPGYVLALLMVVFIVRNAEYTRLQQVLLLSMLTLFVLMFHLPLIGIDYEVVFAAFTISILSILAMLLASLKERKLFQRVVSLVALRFLFVYFQALGGLATTGLGLIVSGVIVLAAASWWNKNRVAITSKIEGWVQ